MIRVVAGIIEVGDRIEWAKAYVNRSPKQVRGYLIAHLRTRCYRARKPGARLHCAVWDYVLSEPMWELTTDSFQYKQLREGKWQEVI